MGVAVLHITLEMVRAGIVPAHITTSKVVTLLNNKKWRRARLYDNEVREMLGGKRVGAGRNYVFNTVKVIELKNQIDNE